MNVTLDVGVAASRHIATDRRVTVYVLGWDGTHLSADFDNSDKAVDFSASPNVIDTNEAAAYTTAV